MDMSRLYNTVEAHGALPPVDRWHPPFCGDIDMRITHDGTWLYNGSPIQRPEMVRLFARILRREGDAYFLVTPVEKVGIAVEDVPFLAVEMTRTPHGLTFRTNMGDAVAAGADHPLRFTTDTGGFKPYLRVRGGLEARLSRSLAQELAGLGEVRMEANGLWFGIPCGHLFFPVAPADHL